jgi:hypothetical protein
MAAPASFVGSRSRPSEAPLCWARRARARAPMQQANQRPRHIDSHPSATCAPAITSIELENLGSIVLGVELEGLVRYVPAASWGVRSR